MYFRINAFACSASWRYQWFYVYARTNLCVRLYVCMYVCRSVCLSVCMYLCIYVCMYACLCFFMSFLFTKDQRDQRLTFDALHPRHLLSPSLSLSCSLTYPLLFLTVIPHVVEFFFSPRPQLLHGDETEDTNNHLSASFPVSSSLSRSALSSIPMHARSSLDVFSRLK